ncbi:diguanylate cyclase [Ammoniphilus sp. CFH 90114]|uniref:GGDEF domain-containing protein n=1 Tax=Ammoniphilus sp. CFH 90114 TaxID=2493665 RepID=UPI0013E959D6|nr:diguanylate cyclase [Ammoniphilus sp. CFH 90114]
MKHTQMGVIAIVSLAVIAMFYLPIQYGEYRFDLRLIPLVFLALRWGLRVGLTVLFITSAWRLALGGEGSMPGVVFGMILPVCFAILYSSLTQYKGKAKSLMFIFTVCWLISDLPIIVFVPDGWTVFKEIFIIRYVTFIIIVYVLYLFIVDSERQIQFKEKLQYLAEHDDLTGLYNMRCFVEKIQQYRRNAKQTPYLVMVDVDYFKAINDTYGHLNGDLILKGVAELIRNKLLNNINITVELGRYGGEEFILFISGMESEVNILRVLEELRQEIEKNHFYSLNQKEAIRVTVSMGVSKIKNWDNIYQTVEAADQSLYISKEHGRNRICLEESLRFQPSM